MSSGAASLPIIGHLSICPRKVPSSDYLFWCAIMCLGWFVALGIVDYQVVQSSRHIGLGVSSGAVVAGIGCLL